MTSNELIGQVAASFLQERLLEDDSRGTARYLLDYLTAEQTVAIAKAILKDSKLAQQVDIKLPMHFVGSYDLPSEVLTNERTTFFRNANCEKAVLLVANTGDDESQSLKELVPIGTSQLLANPKVWVDLAAKELLLTEQHKNWWFIALHGLLQSQPCALDRFAEYVLEAREAVIEGYPILSALGIALPALRIPKDTAYFNSLNEKTTAHSSKWKALYNNAIKKRACFLIKQTPNNALLSEEDLIVTFDEVKDSIPAEVHGIVEAFIHSASGWNVQATELAMCEWESVKPLFDGYRREQFNLGKATLEFYDERQPELISNDERDYLERLIKRKTTEAQEEDEQFYNDHRIELKEIPSLKARWDRFVFGSPLETEDFLVGIALCMETLMGQDLHGVKKRLIIQSDRRSQKDLKDLNVDAGLLFAHRYRGLQKLFGRRVQWDVGKLFEFDQLDKAWRAKKRPHVNRSVAKSALQLKFYLQLEVQFPNGNSDTYSKQLHWIFNASAVPSELAADWSRLVGHPLIYCRANREPVSSKGRFQSVNLKDVKTFIPTYDKDRGSFVAAYKKENDISLIWPDNLTKAIRDGHLHEKTGNELLKSFNKFRDNYAKAITGFYEDGIASDYLLKQLEDYANVLFKVCTEAKGDRNRSLLLRPLLEVGTVSLEGGSLTAIIAPWHPLRLAAIAHKSRQITALVNHLMIDEEVYFGDSRLFFKELKEEMLHPYYPEIVLGWNQNKAELLSLTDYYLDYSLHEVPVASNEGFDETNENPTESSLLILDLIKRYLSLYPHERTNLSIVLYNCDAARLPQAIVDKINELHEDEEDMRCQVILRHRDGQKLRGLYEKIIESSENEADSFVASEATRDFMARLRIGIMVDQAPVPDPKDGPPTDLVFLQDVIARHARIDWYLEAAKPMEADYFMPARWSRRRPSAADDMKSVVYLCCPVQTREGWTYISALTTFFKGDWDGVEDKRLLPARQLDFNEPSTAVIFKEIHNLGNWVINYDELLDKRQLLNQSVKVIRYKQGSTQGKNVLISSTAPLGLLKSMVLNRVRDLNISLSDQDYALLAEKFINDANEISGDIVLRAAKRGRNASELMGIVLSRYMIRKEIGTNRYLGWYFLDDYADWLGQREQQIADILALSPMMTDDGNLRLDVLISEAKYIDFVNLASKRKESQKQLRDTVRRISDALFGNPKRLDRDLWLSRFSDLVLSGIQFPASSSIDLSAWRRGIREGNCHIYLRGYSHVFISGPTDAPECSDFAAIAELEDSYQEIYSRQKLRELVLAYWKDSDTLYLRKELAGKDIWTEKAYRKPSEKLIITVRQAHDQEELEKEALAKPSEVTQSTTISVSQEKQDNIIPESPLTVKGEDIKNESNKPSCWTNPTVGTLISNYQERHVDSSQEAVWLKQVENLCKGALQQFQLQATLRSSTLTPNAALLKFQGSANLTVDHVIKRRTEFLTTHKLNIIQVKAEPGLVTISIARPNRHLLRLLEVWKNWQPNCLNGNYELLIGLKEEDGSPLYLSPHKNAPHTLIAGSTGSGKSVLMQNIILAVACTNTPMQAQITLIDPKLGVDYFSFEGLPHLQGGVIDNQEDAIAALNRLIDEMNRRYSILRQNRVANIFDLNNKVDASEHLPFLWVIHDEFAEWMMTDQYRDTVSNIVSRLGVKARAAGIFLVFAAQRPDAKVMPMQLRANLGNRLILRVDGEGTSEIALGEKGAERLLGKGHLAAKLEGEDSIISAQVPFIDSNELSQIVKLLVN